MFTTIYSAVQKVTPSGLRREKNVEAKIITVSATRSSVLWLQG